MFSGNSSTPSATATPGNQRSAPRRTLNLANYFMIFLPVFFVVLLALFAIEHRRGTPLGDTAGYQSRNSRTDTIGPPCAAATACFSLFRLSGIMKMCRRLHGRSEDRTIGWAATQGQATLFGRNANQSRRRKSKNGKRSGERLKPSKTRPNPEALTGLLRGLPAGWFERVAVSIAGFRTHRRR